MVTKNTGDEFTQVTAYIDGKLNGAETALLHAGENTWKTNMAEAFYCLRQAHDALDRLCADSVAHIDGPTANTTFRWHKASGEMPVSHGNDQDDDRVFLVWCESEQRCEITTISTNRWKKCGDHWSFCGTDGDPYFTIDWEVTYWFEIPLPGETT